MTEPETAWLSRAALARVLRSLLRADLAAARGRRGSSGVHLPAAWPEDMRFADAAPQGPGCDSLEMLWLRSAASEMFNLSDYDRHHALDAPRFGDWLDAVGDAWSLAERRGTVPTLTFSSSGSTGRPNRHAHRLSDLADEARRFARHLQAAAPHPTRVLAFAPSHHIYGFLFAAMLPDALKGAVLEDAEAERALSRLEAGDLIIAFPDRWRCIERVVRRWPADVRGVTSGAPCAPALIASLIGAGLAGMTEVYGSSETAGIALREWPAPAYALLPRWRFSEAGDEIVDRRGTTVPLPDEVSRRADDTFLVLGRRDGAVQVGGVNVHPEEVAAALRAHPGVAEAAVRLMRPDEGLGLKTFIVAEAGMVEDTLRGTLERWFQAEWDAARRPRHVTFGARLPRTALGKPTDW